jgi:hypothetical protein
MLNKEVGGVYIDSMTMVDDHAQRFAVHEYILRDVTVSVATQTIVFGNQSRQTFPRADTKELTFQYLDLQYFWFKNAGAGANGTVHIIGTTVY